MYYAHLMKGFQWTSKQSISEQLYVNVVR